jgi:FKBP-type peptidyl-prolyl cis-trans isomerase SlyD
MKAQIVSFHCVVKDKMGRVISSTFNRDILTYDGSQPSVLVGLVRGLQDLKKGEKRRIVVPANEAYGFYDPRQVLHCSRENLARQHKVKLGDKIMLSGDEEKNVYRVTEIYGDKVTLDANHPLAGQDLVFEIETTEARPATPDEVERSMKDEDSSHLH